MRFLRAEEGRDFSYHVDVLSCASQVFLVETQSKRKADGEQKSRRRSNRKLLFDCINLGLMVLLLQLVSVCAPWPSLFVSSRISYRQGTEEASWVLLIGLEYEAGKESEDELRDDLGLVKNWNNPWILTGKR